MDFSEALFLLKAGKRVRRASWSEEWEWMEVNRWGTWFSVKFKSVEEAMTFDVSTNMILAEDWQEVEGEKA